MLSRHLHPPSVLELNKQALRAVCKTPDGDPALYAALITDLDAGRAGTPSMPQQDVWDSEGTNSNFKLSYVLEAEPARPEGAPKTCYHPCPAHLVGYEAFVSSLILGLGGSLQDPRLLLASASSNTEFGNLFSKPYYSH